jgi:tetratricopeptide repeat protein
MSYDLMFQQALALHEQGRFDEAESLYRQILETAPRNPDVLNLLGLVAQAKGIHNEAVELFYKAVCEAPTHAPFYFNLALSLDLWDKPHEALDNYRKALKIDPGIKEAWNNIGTLCQKLGQAAEAETAYRRAAALDSEYAEPRVNLARMKKDLSELKALAKRFPHDALSLYFLADEHYRAGEYDLAAEYATQASANAPTDAEIKILSGLICLAQENTAEARICFQKALALDPRSVPALVNLANLETAAGEYETAEKHYKRALELSPQNLDAHINYADMLYRQKRLPEALEEYRTAVVIDPGIPEISNNLGVILKDIGEYEEALGLFFNAFNQRPETGEFSVNIAETLTLLHGQKPETAVKIAQNWHRQAPDNAFAVHICAALQGKLENENNQIYVEKLFDNFADNYELVLQKLDYGVVRSLRNFTGPVEGTLVDLGCGTGLAGLAYQAAGTRLVGVDISEKMLAQARKKGIYKELIKADIVSWLLQKPQADAFVAADVFNYIGRLESVIDAAAPVKLAFSTEDDHSVDTCRLTPSGRFAHNPEYVEKLLQKAGYHRIERQSSVLRTENGQPVKGTLWKTW